MRFEMEIISYTMTIKEIYRKSFENLRVLKLFSNRISDITPLAGLINLEILELQDNRIVDISPLNGTVGWSINACTCYRIWMARFI